MNSRTVKDKFAILYLNQFTIQISVFETNSDTLHFTILDTLQQN